MSGCISATDLRSGIARAIHPERFEKTGNLHLVTSFFINQPAPQVAGFMLENRRCPMHRTFRRCTRKPKLLSHVFPCRETGERMQNPEWTLPVPQRAPPSPTHSAM